LTFCWPSMPVPGRGEIPAFLMTWTPTKFCERAEIRILVRFQQFFTIFRSFVGERLIQNDNPKGDE